MKLNNPFLTGLSHLLCGRSKTKVQAVLARERQALIEGGPDVQQQFLEEVPPELLELHSATQRVRSYPDPLTFWAFFTQVSSDDASCAGAVALVQSWARGRNLPVPSGGTSSYCEARAKLPEGMLRAVNASLYQQLEAHLPSRWEWRGLRPKAEDGTSAQMPDTDANRAAYPYPSGQSDGCGFPMIRLGGLVDLSHGGVCDFAHSDMQTGELRGHDQLEAEHLGEGDLLIADRLFSTYEVVARLVGKGVNFVGRNHQARKVDFRRGRKIGRDERLVTWIRPRQRPAGCRLSREEWDALPDEMEMRLIRCKGPDRRGKQKVRYVVTTLLDAGGYPAGEVASLYYHRWEIEVRFRDIKTTLGMEMLRTRSPEMVRKEVLMHMIVYNLMRLVMLKAGIAHGVNHRRLSFRGTQQVIHASRGDFRDVASRPVVRQRHANNMRERLAERYVKERPGRNEPRRVKRRPKNTRWLQRPRHEYFEHFRSDDPPLKILDNPA